MGDALLLGSPTQVLDAQQLIAAFENSPEGLPIADHGRIVYANAAFAELFAYSDRVEMSGKALSSLRPRSHQCERTSLGSSPASESGGRVCHMSGYEPQSEEQTNPVVLFRKPFTGAALLGKVREVLDAGSPGLLKEQDHEGK